MEERNDDGRVLWSKAPEEKHALCDWSIDIAVEGSADRTARFDVHRFPLVTSPRKSSFFDCLFTNGNFSASSEKVTRMQQLTEGEFLEFPNFLDYLYGLDIVIGEDNSVVLYKLADYFGVEDLLYEIQEILDESTTHTPENFKSYFHQYNLYPSEKLWDFLCDIYFCHVDEFYREDPDYYWGIDARNSYVDSQLMLEVLKRAKARNDQSISYSWLVADVCLKERHDLSVETFAELTSEASLSGSGMTFDTAIKFLQAEQDILGRRDSDNLTSLQKRCVEAIARHWFCEGSSDIDKLLTTQNLDSVVLEAVRQATVARIVPDVVPDKIVVCGAGCPEVNGIYEQDLVELHGFHRKRRVYFKYGVWENVRRCFSILESDPNHWQIWVILSNDDKITRRFAIYDSEAGSIFETSFKPPKTTWTVYKYRCNDDLKPAPKLEYVYDNTVSSDPANKE